MNQKLLTLFLLIAVLTVFVVPVSGQDEVAVPEVLTLPEQIAEGRDVTITVSNMPPADQAKNPATWEAQAARFILAAHSSLLKERAKWSSINY